MTNERTIIKCEGCGEASYEDWGKCWRCLRSFSLDHLPEARSSLQELIDAGGELSATQQRALKKKKRKGVDRLDEHRLRVARKQGTLCDDCGEPMKELDIGDVYICTGCHGDCDCRGDDGPCHACEHSVEAV